jgi:hypothetical protein
MITVELTEEERDLIVKILMNTPISGNVSSLTKNIQSIVTICNKLSPVGGIEPEQKPPPKKK